MEFVYMHVLCVSRPRRCLFLLEEYGRSKKNVHGFRSVLCVSIPSHPFPSRPIPSHPHLLQIYHTATTRPDLFLCFSFSTWVARGARSVFVCLLACALISIKGRGYSRAGDEGRQGRDRHRPPLGRQRRVRAGGRREARPLDDHPQQDLLLGEDEG